METWNCFFFNFLGNPAADNLSSLHPDHAQAKPDHAQANLLGIETDLDPTCLTLVVDPTEFLENINLDNLEKGDKKACKIIQYANN